MGDYKWAADRIDQLEKELEADDPAGVAGKPERAEHELKCWPEFFRSLLSGEKTFELRRDDRGFRAGDVLWLREWRRLKVVDGQAEGEYTGREMRRTVSYVLSGFGLEPGFVCLGLQEDYDQLRAELEAERTSLAYWMKEVDAGRLLIWRLSAELDAARAAKEEQAEMLQGVVKVAHGLRVQVAALQAQLDAAVEALRAHGGVLLKSGLAASIAMMFRSMHSTRDVLVQDNRDLRAQLDALPPVARLGPVRPPPRFYFESDEAELVEVKLPAGEATQPPVDPPVEHVCGLQGYCPGPPHYDPLCPGCYQQGPNNED